jgi:chorismate-pyruvate lyase
MPEEPSAGARRRADAHEDGRRALVETPPGVLQRVLLTTDGSVGRILEVYADEPIEVVKLEQWSAPCGQEQPALELGADDEGLRRRVILRGAETCRSFIHAECLIALERLHPTVRSGLLDTDAPIGKLLTTVRAETFREILSAGRAPAGALCAHFGIDETDELFVRTYRIIANGLPIMLITEKFPTTWFLS